MSETIYKMTLADKRCLRGHPGRMVLHLSAEDGNTSVYRFPTLHLTRSVFVPKTKDGMIDPRGKCSQMYEVDGCGEFEHLSDVVYVLKTTGRLKPHVKGKL